MKPSFTAFSILAYLALGGSSQLLPFFSRLRQGDPAEFRSAQQEQSPFMEQNPNLVLPGTGTTPKDKAPSSSILISDVVGRSHDINVFASLTRDITSIAARLDSTSANSTILAPLNAEIYKLPRKPWEDPQDYEKLGTQAYEGQDGSDRANANLRRFVEAHVVPESPWRKEVEIETLAGRKIWWEEREAGQKLVRTLKVSSPRGSRPLTIDCSTDSTAWHFGGEYS